MKKLLWILLLLLIIIGVLYWLFCRTTPCPDGSNPPCTTEVDPIDFRYIVDYTIDTVDYEKLEQRYINWGGKIIKTCDCDSLKLWDFSEFPVTDPEERKQAAKDTLGPASNGYIALNIYISDKEPALVDTCYNNYIPKPLPPQDVLTAIIDSGVDFDNDALQNAIWQNPAACEGGPKGLNMINPTEDPMDSLGHGTHVSGLSYLPLQNEKLMVIKVLNQEGSGTLFDAICGVHFAVNNKAEVINFSMGYTGERNSVFETAIDKAEKNKTIIVCSAGNDTTNIDTLANGIGHWPGSFNNSNIINVAAVGQLDNGTWELAPFSNYDVTSVDIGAPGVGVQSLALSGETGTAAGVKSGTSMAAALVTQSLVRIKHKLPANVTMDAILNALTDPVPVPSLQGKTRLGKMLKVDYWETTDSCYSLCRPVYDKGAGDAFIDGIRLANYSSFGNGRCQGNTYSDFTRRPIVLVQGGNYNLEVRNAQDPCFSTYTEASCIAWIDFNDDREFTANEVITMGTFTKYQDNLVQPFNLPGNVLGVKKMRVRSWRGGLQNPLGYCDNSTYGETEDYTVVIQVPVLF